MQPTGATELNPWLILLDAGQSTSLAMWQWGGSATEESAFSLAIFSSRELATQYAQRYCSPQATVAQFPELELIRALASCYEGGVRYASLDPTHSTARQLFNLRDVLSAAKQRLKSQLNR